MFKSSQNKKKLFNLGASVAPNFLQGFDGRRTARNKKINIKRQQVKTRRLEEKARRKLEKSAQRDLRLLAKKNKDLLKLARVNREEIRSEPLPKKWTLSYVGRLWRERQTRRRLEHYEQKFDRQLQFGEKKLFLFRKKNFSIPAPSRRPWFWGLLIFAASLFLVVAPFKFWAQFNNLDNYSFKERIIQKTKSAFESLGSGGKASINQNWRQAEKDFNSAENQFSQVSANLKIINDRLLSLASYANNPELKLVAESKKLLQIGALGSELAAELAAALSGWERANGDWLVLLDQLEKKSESAQSLADNLVSKLETIKVENLPAEYQADFKEIISRAEILPTVLSLLSDNAGRFKKLLGSGTDKRYLLVFQNNAEMRGSGGFLGSYALIDFRDGKITNLEVPGGGSYDTEAGLRLNIVAPEPLWLVNPKWHFWDANWWPDWPTTARNLMWFLEKSDGPTVDGVISFTPSVVEELLKITGPIDLSSDYGVVVTADNFWQEVQLTAERDNLIEVNPELVAHLPLGEENKPKKIIGALAQEILEILPEKMNQTNFLKLAALAEDSLAAKQVLLYFSDPDLQQMVNDWGWGGVMTQAPYDYLMVTNTNIAGAKTDRMIRETINQQVNIQNNGRVVVSLKIKREHTAAPHTPLVGVRNVNWMRIYVPEGAKLLRAEGFKTPDEHYFESPDPAWQDNEILKETEGRALIDPLSGTKVYLESGKTVFANWSMVDPGETSELFFEYELPSPLPKIITADNWFKRFNNWLNPEQMSRYNYSLLLQKQPGAVNDNYQLEVKWPDNYTLDWQGPGLVGGLAPFTPLTRDHFYSLAFSKY
ncbi:DUF4012 domain-containing protein [Candidatus Falkowbacteria bacterium]|nr:DUF4012 domain-containing protein [Candidatus Falkowbacteria bacterium]